MAAYNFKKEFAPAIKSGKKRCTMRQRRKNGYIPKPGECLTLYSGMRSKGCEKLATVKVKAVTPITISDDDGITEVVLDGAKLLPGQIHQIAVLDGFDGVEEFGRFFRSQYGTQAHLYLIEW